VRPPANSWKGSITKAVRKQSNTALLLTVFCPAIPRCLPTQLTPVNNKQGNKHYRCELTDDHFRLVIIESKIEGGKEYWFLTNDFKRSAKEIAQAYRKRWDIEVFFRFLKQELNVSHLVSLNKNGIQVILYMALTVAMMVLMYKKANNIGYKTAKRRFAIEVRDLAIALSLCNAEETPPYF
jgi:hypothetical protein